MATNVVALGRRILIALVLVAGCLELAAASIASFIGGRTAEGAVYGVTIIVLLFVGLSNDSIKNFLHRAFLTRNWQDGGAVGTNVLPMDAPVEVALGVG